MKLNSKSINYNVQTVDELVSLDGLEGDTVVVTDEDRGGVFVYREDNVGTNNGGTIFNGWTRQYDGAVDVKWFGAKGDCIAPPTFNTIPTGTDDTSVLKLVLEGGFEDIIFPPNKKFLVTDTITPSPCNINFNGSTVVMDTTSKTKPIFIASGQARKKWENGTMQGSSYIPLSGIKFTAPDNQAMELHNIASITCRYGVYLDEGEVINRIIFNNCAFTSNLISGVWFKSYTSVYAHSAPVFFNNTVLNGNGVPTWIGTSKYKEVQVVENTLKWGVQLYAKGISTLVWNGGQISDHSHNYCLAHVLVENSNGVSFIDFDFEDLANPVRLDGTVIANPSTNETVFSSLEGGAMTFSGVSDIKVELEHTTSISQQSFIKVEYTCNNVKLSLPSDNKIGGCRYSVNAFGQGLNTTNIYINTPTKKINNATLANIVNNSLVSILSSGNKLGSYYSPVAGSNVHFDVATLDGSNSKYSVPYSPVFDLKSVNSCYLKALVIGIESLGVKVYSKDEYYDVDTRFIISYYDSSDAFISSSTPITVRPTTNTINGYGLTCVVSDIPANTVYARFGFLNSANYNAVIPGHGRPIAFNVFALGSYGFKTMPIVRNVVQ